MDELKNKIGQLKSRLEKFEDECYDKDINLDVLNTYQDLKDSIEDIIQSVPIHCEKLDKIVQELLFI